MQLSSNQKDTQKEGILHCTKCGAEISSFDVHCRSCGAVVTTPDVGQQQVDLGLTTPEEIESGFAEKNDGEDYIPAEQWHPKITAYGIGAVISSFLIMAINGGLVWGLLVLACGIATLVVTKFGKQWYTLPVLQKTIAFPGLAVGFVAGQAVILAIYIVVAAIGLDLWESSRRR